MSDNQAELARQDPRAKVGQLRRDHPECDIRLITTQMWESVSYPKRGQIVVHVAESLDELRARIERDASES